MMKNKKSPSNPIYERYTHDWARRVIAKELNINTQFMPREKQWGEIVLKLVNMKENTNGSSI